MQTDIEYTIQNMKTILVSLNKTMQQINAIITLDKINGNDLLIYKSKNIFEKVKKEYDNLLDCFMRKMLNEVDVYIIKKYDIQGYFLNVCDNKLFYDGQLVYEMSIDDIDDFTADNIAKKYIVMLKPEIELHEKNYQLILSEANELITAKVIKNAVISSTNQRIFYAKIFFDKKNVDIYLNNREYFKGKLTGIVKNNKALNCKFNIDRLIDKRAIGNNSKIHFIPGKLDLHTGKFGVDTIYDSIVMKNIRKAIDIIQYNYYYNLKRIYKEDYIINNHCYYRHIKSFENDGTVYDIYAVRFAGSRVILKLFDDTDECITGRKYRKLMSNKLSEEETIALSNFL